jgi:hypothetical protein
VGGFWRRPRPTSNPGRHNLWFPSLSVLRRTYKSETEPAAEGAYDFVTYFECADADVPIFHQVCASLRDVAKNPEWKFVREGPTWHGRRVAAWPDLFTERT